ncbi:Kinesin family member 4 isoform 2 putati [Globisporangium polare]
MERPQPPASVASPSSSSPDAKPHANRSSVQVAVRVRPLSASEEAQASEACVQAVGTLVLLGGSGGKQFDFDAAFPPQVQQQQVYEQLVAPLIDRFFDGYNATVFAYGQTGSGKTFTMGNEFKLSVAPADRGIIPRAMDDIFRRVEIASEDKKTVVKVSYLEILNEEIYDLLSEASNSSSAASASSSTGLSVRDEGKRGIVVAGLSEHNVESITQVASLLHAGALRRATASTVMNAQSSRSHAICTVTMEQYDTVSEGVEARFSKFHLVDLAGSERAKRTNAVGARFKEGVNINRGLLSLGNVINALCERSRASSAAANTHVPYRDSKLTRLLQDSLGGNSKTLMIACISPADINFEETSNTLRYASRARNIQNSAVVNKEMSAANEVAYLRQQLELLQLQLMQQSKPSQQTRGGRVVAATARGNHLLNADVAELEAELLKWKDVACTREEELRMVMSAKNKWKKVADEFMAKKKKSVASTAPSFGFGVRGAGSAASSNAVSPTTTLALEAMEFEKTIQIQIPDVAATSETQALSPDHEQTQADLDNLSDVIVEKEKIMQELAALPSSSGTEARLASLTTSYEQKIIKLENRVGRLAAEKKRLSLEIKASGQSADAADQKNKEDVRAQLQQIQSQLQVAKQAGEECKRLTALWKSGKFKISALEQDIVDMKKQKAGLQRKLRAEAETHRREKREQDLKILQLKRQDQRKQHELQKLTALHSKQNSVLKRKTEEIVMANKRMRTMAQSQQQMKKTTQENKPATVRSSSSVNVKQEAGGETGKPARSDYMENVAKVLEKTFEIRMAIQGAKNAIQMDLEERKGVALEISRLEQSSPSAASSDALANLKDALKEKNAEIRLLQQKLASVERGNAIPDELFPASAIACHQIIRHLVDTAAESKSSCLDLENSIVDIDAVEEQLVTQTDKYECVIAGLKREMQELGRHGGISLDAFEFYSSNDVVVPGGSSKPNPLLQQELDETKKELEDLKLQVAAQVSLLKKKPAAKKKRAEEIIDIDEIVSSSEHDDDDDESEDDDSDYVEDEGKRRTPKSRSRASTTPSASVKAQRPSGPGAGDGADPMNEIDELLAKPSRAGMPLCCSCNGKCATRACACKAEKQKCGSDCACNASKCHNREGFEGVKKSKKSRKSELDDKENEVESFFYVAAVGVDKENDDPAPPPSKLKKLWTQHDSKMEEFGSARKAKLSGSAVTPPSLLKKPNRKFVLKPTSTNVPTSSSNSNSSSTTSSRISRFL